MEFGSQAQWVAATVSVIMAVVALRKYITNFLSYLLSFTPYGKLCARIDEVELRQAQIHAAILAILAGSGEAWAWADSKGRVRWVTPGFENVTGRGGMRVLGDGWINAINDVDAEQIRYNLTLGMGSWENWEQTVQLFNNGKSGKYRLSMLIIRPEHDPDDVGGILISLRKKEASSSIDR
jgi:PAS domain-containing protein